MPVSGSPAATYVSCRVGGPSDAGVLTGLVMCAVGVAVLVAAFVGARRHPGWNWRNGPARWLGTLGILLLLGGLINVVIAR